MPSAFTKESFSPRPLFEGTPDRYEPVIRRQLTRVHETGRDNFNLVFMQGIHYIGIKHGGGSKEFPAVSKKSMNLVYHGVIPEADNVNIGILQSGFKCCCFQCLFNPDAWYIVPERNGSRDDRIGFAC